MEHKPEATRADESVDTLLTHIDQELSWASESTRGDGWSSQVISVTIAGLAVFVFQSIGPPYPPDWPQILTRFLVISYSWDSLFALYDWVKRRPGGTAVLTTATRGFSTKTLAPIRALGLFTLVRLTSLLLVAFTYGAQHLGGVPAALISAHVALRLLAMVCFVILLLGDWYPPTVLFRKDTHGDAKTRVLGSMEVAVAVAISVVSLSTIQMFGNSTTLPAAGLVAMLHLTQILLAREGGLISAGDLRSLRRAIVVGTLDVSQARDRLSEIIIGDSLDKAAAPFMARHRELISEGESLSVDLDRHAASLDAAAGPVTGDERAETRRLLERLKAFYLRTKEVNAEAGTLFASRGWRAVRLRLDVRWQSARAQFHETYAKLGDQYNHLEHVRDRWKEAVDRRGSLDRESVPHTRKEDV